MKWFWSILSAIIIAIFVTAIVFYTNSGAIIGHILTTKVGMPVIVDKASFSTKSIKLNGLKILNPKGMLDKSALDISKIFIHAPLTNYLKEIVEIKKVQLDDVILRIEFLSDKKGGSNWKQLMKENDQNSAPVKPQAPSSQQNNDSTPPISPAEKSMQISEDSYANIKLLEINNITIEVVVGGKVTSQKKIDKLQFKNLTTTRNDITKRITQVIIHQLMFNVKNLIDFPLYFKDAATDAFMAPFKLLFPHNTGEDSKDQ